MHARTRSPFQLDIGTDCQQLRQASRLLFTFVVRRALSFTWGGPTCRSGYTFHLFALLKPVVAFACDSPFAGKAFGELNSRECLQSTSRYWQGSGWTPARDLVPRSAAVRVLHELVREGGGRLLCGEQCERACVKKKGYYERAQCSPPEPRSCSWSWIARQAADLEARSSSLC